MRIALTIAGSDRGERRVFRPSQDVSSFRVFGTTAITPSRAEHDRRGAPGGAAPTLVASRSMPSPTTCPRAVKSGMLGAARSSKPLRTMQTAAAD